MGNKLPHELPFKDKGYLLKKISKAAHDKPWKSSPKHTFLPGTRKEHTSNKRHDASTVIRTFLVSNMIKTTKCDQSLTP